MTRWAVRTTLGLVLGLGAIAGSDISADDNKSTPAAPVKEPPVNKGKAPDFTGYVSVTTVMGEVVKSSDTSLTIRVYWQAANAKNGQAGRGRPQLYANHGRSYRNPYAMRRPQQPQMHWEHHDYELEYTPNSLVRTKTLPPRLNADGKKIPYTEKERDELKVPYSVIGYQASKADLKPATVVEVFVIRDKSIPAAKVKEDDMRIKYVVIFGEDPNPPKDLATPGKTDPKKKN